MARTLERVAEQERCPHCGALNKVGAEWCGQCLVRLIAPPPPPTSVPSPPGIEARASAPGETADLLSSPLRSGGTDSFRVTDEGITWRCAVCENVNDLGQSICTVCGASFAETVRPAPPERPPRDPGTAALLSLIFPGAGHWYVGLKGQAIARAVISMWVVSVAIIAAIQKGVPGSIPLALVFGLAATALWMVAAHDAFREAQGDESQVLLRGRAFMYIVLGLLFLLMVMMIPAVLSVRTG